MENNVRSSNTENSLLERLHPAVREKFIPLPSDPNQPWTAEQIAALFAGCNEDALREMMQLGNNEMRSRRG